VHAAEAVPPKGVPHHVTLNKLKHVDILSDLPNVEALLLKMIDVVSARNAGGGAAAQDK
jgi:hypothetical protein